MGRTFKDKNKNRRFSENEYESDYESSKNSKQNAKRFRQDRGNKRSVKDEDLDANDE